VVLFTPALIAVGCNAIYGTEDLDVVPSHSGDGGDEAGSVLHPDATAPAGDGGDAATTADCGREGTAKRGGGSGEVYVKRFIGEKRGPRSGGPI
jgi:hypothetical protein